MAALDLLQTVDPTYLYIEQEEYHNILNFLTSEGKLTYSEANALPWPKVKLMTDWQIRRLQEEDKQRRKAQQLQESESWVESRIKGMSGARL